MATLPPSASPFDPVLEIEHATIDGKACAHAYYVAISERSYKARDSGPGATRDKVLLATVTEDALRMFPIHIRRDAHDYLTPKYDQLKTITIPLDDDGWSIPDSPGVHANYADEAYAATYKLHNSALNGTCSLYRRPAPDTALYLVTTQHQLEGSKGDFCQLVLREPQADGSFKRNDFKVVTRVDGKPTWVKHPKFDLAVLRIATAPTGTFSALPIEAIANDERLKAARPSVGSPLLLFTFPHGVESIRQGFPVARQAVFAQPPLLSSTAYPTFQADFPATAGDSGGPGVIEGPGGKPLIIGMCFQRMNHDEKVTTQTSSTTIKHPLNMGTFIHGRYLLEAIELAAQQ